MTSHCLAGNCGARARACRVGTPADARRGCAEKRREESRRCTQNCLRHAAVLLAVAAAMLSGAPIKRTRADLLRRPRQRRRPRSGTPRRGSPVGMGIHTTGARRPTAKSTIWKRLCGAPHAAVQYLGAGSERFQLQVGRRAHHRPRAIRGRAGDRFVARGGALHRPAGSRVGPVRLEVIRLPQTMEPAIFAVQVERSAAARTRIGCATLWPPSMARPAWSSGMAIRTCGVCWWARRRPSTTPAPSPNAFTPNRVRKRLRGATRF